MDDIPQLFRFPLLLLRLLLILTLLSTFVDCAGLPDEFDYNDGNGAEKIKPAQINLQGKKDLVAKIKAVTATDTDPDKEKKYRSRLFGFGTYSSGDEDFDKFDERLAQLLLAIDPRSEISREEKVDEQYMDGADGVIKTLLKEYAEVAKADSKQKASFDPTTGKEGKILEAIQAIFKPTAENLKSTEDPEKILEKPLGFTEADEKYMKIREKLGPTTGLATGLGEAIKSATLRMEYAFDNYLGARKTAKGTDVPTGGEEAMVKAVGEIEGMGRANEANVEKWLKNEQMEKVDKEYRRLRTQIPLYDINHAAPAQPAGSRMPNMRDGRFRRAIEALNFAFATKLEKLDNAEYKKFENQLDILKKIEKEKAEPKETFERSADATTEQDVKDIDGKYAEKIVQLNKIRKESKWAGMKMWAREAIKRMGQDYNKLVKGIAIGSMPNFDKALGNMLAIESAIEYTMFLLPAIGNPSKYPQIASITDLEAKIVERKKANEREEMEKKGYTGLAARGAFTEELMDEEFLRVASGPPASDPFSTIAHIQGDDPMATHDAKVRMAAENGKRIVESEPNTLAYPDGSGMEGLKELDEKYAEKYKELNMEDGEVNKYKQLEQILKGIAIEMGKDYNRLAKEELKKAGGGKMGTEVEEMLGRLETLEGAKSDEEVLSEQSQITATTTLKEVDEKYKTRMEVMEKGAAGERTLASLEGMRGRIKRAKKRMNAAYDQLTMSGPSKLAPQEAVDLRDELKKIEGAKSEKSAFGFPEVQPLTANDLDKLEEKWTQLVDDINGRLGNAAIKQLGGLTMRAGEALKVLDEHKKKALTAILVDPKKVDAWEELLIVEKAENGARGKSEEEKALALFATTKPVDKVKLDARKAQFDSKLRPDLFGAVELAAVKKRMEQAQQWVKEAYDKLAPKPAPASPSQQQQQPPSRPVAPPKPDAKKEEEMEMEKEFDNKPPKMDNNCRDTALNCKLRMCTVPSYVREMHAYCPKTCAVCMSPDKPCMDLNQFDCPMWNSLGYCTSRAYSKGMKFQQCAATCGLCPPGTG